MILQPGGPAPSYLPHRLLFDRMLIATLRQDAGGRAEWPQRTGKTPLVRDATHQVHAGLVGGEGRRSGRHSDEVALQTSSFALHKPKSKHQLHSCLAVSTTADLAASSIVGLQTSSAFWLPNSACSQRARTHWVLSPIRAVVVGREMAWALLSCWAHG